LAGAEDADLAGAAGAWEGDLVAVRWRLTHMTEHRPELVVFYENRSRTRVGLHYLRNSEVCSGVPVWITGDTAWWNRQGNMGLDVILSPGEWYVAIVPLGFRLESASGDVQEAKDCFHRSRWTFSSLGEKNHLRDQLRIEVPFSFEQPAE
jgi:hypothetical protein